MKRSRWYSLDIPILKEEMERDPCFKNSLQEANEELYNYIYDIPESTSDDELIFPMEESPDTMLCQHLYENCMRFFKCSGKSSSSSITIENIPPSNSTSHETTPLTSDNENLKSYSN